MGASAAQSWGSASGAVNALGFLARALPSCPQCPKGQRVPPSPGGAVFHPGEQGLALGWGRSLLGVRSGAGGARALEPGAGTRGCTRRELQILRPSQTTTSLTQSQLPTIFRRPLTASPLPTRGCLFIIFRISSLPRGGCTCHRHGASALGTALAPSTAARPPRHRPGGQRVTDSGTSAAPGDK